MDVLAPYRDLIDSQTLLIGHSLGGLFLLKLLELCPSPVRASYIVAAPAGVKPILFYDADAAFCNGFDFDWDTIRANTGHVEVFHSDNDPYVDIANGRHIAEKLGAHFNFIPNAGHINATSGYMKFPQLLEKIIHHIDTPH